MTLLGRCVRALSSVRALPLVTKPLAGRSVRFTARCVPSYVQELQLRRSLHSNVALRLAFSIDDDDFPEDLLDTAARRQRGFNSDIKRRLFVTNFEYEVTEDELSDWAKQNEVDAIEDIKIFKAGDGRSRGCGTMLLRSPDLINEAIEKLNNTQVRGRRTFVREMRDEPPPRRPASRTGDLGLAARQGMGGGENYRLECKVLLGNVGEDATWMSLKDFTAEFGPVTYAKVLGKGSAVVEFSDRDKALEAVKLLEGQLFGDRKLTAKMMVEEE